MIRRNFNGRGQQTYQPTAPAREEDESAILGLVAFAAFATAAQRCAPGLRTI